MSGWQARAQAIAGRLPAPVADRLLPGRRREFAEAGTTNISHAPVRLLIAPVNSAGQGFQWARAAERIPGVAACNMMFRRSDDVFGFPADHSVPALVLTRNQRWRTAQKRAVAQRFSHVIIESGYRLFEPEGSVDDDLEYLRRRGLSVAFLWHGSDIRMPSIHAASEPDSPFIDRAYVDTDVLETIATRNRGLSETADVPLFVSTPDLLSYVPTARWLPVVVDTQRWAGAASRPALERTRPVVVHAPSRAGLKGSALIASIVQSLHVEGVIEYREAHGIPARDMPQFYGDADVVLDQFSLGIYGVAACEALASGRLVVSHVSDVTRDAVRNHTGQELPIVEARASQLESVLRDISARPDEFRERARRGPSFVKDVHDGTFSARVLESFLR